MEINKIYNMDCLEGMKLLEDNSVDSIVTDPPYELGFMGKAWDSTGIAYNTEVWKEALRVLKPGGHLLSFGGTRTYHRMACAIEDAGFEIRDQIQWIYGCLSDDTECLTIDGWRKHTELTKDTIVMQWDSDSNELSWVKPNNIMVYPAPKTMIHLQNRHTDQVLTANHRVYGRFQKHSRNEFPKNYTVELAGNLKNCWIKALPLAGNLHSGINVPNAYLVGWWLTDAWKHGDGKACMFSQSKVKTLDKLRKALTTADCKVSEYTKRPRKPEHQSEHTFYVTGKLSEYLLENFANRELTMEVLGWDFDSRMALLEGLLDGDGTRNKNKSSETFWSKKSDRLDVVQALCLSLNIRNHIDYNKGCVYLNKKTNETQVSYAQTCETMEYIGNSVWCISVPNGAFVVRRNGRAFITGNSGFPKSMDVSKAIDKAAGATREVVGTTVTRDLSRHNGEIKGDMLVGCSMGSAEISITAPATPEAKQWQGYGTALKPANEPIVLARKPLSEKTIAANVLKWDTGGINIDECRIPTTDKLGGGMVSMGRPKVAEGWDRPWMHDEAVTTVKKAESAAKVAQAEALGRFPANVIFDEEAGRILDEQSGQSKSIKGKQRSAKVNNQTKLNNSTNTHVNCEYNDTGGASRFFYCAKSSRKERGEGNIHPTVKPIKLMEYLVTLVTPPNGIVLDPFVGSGTTMMAAKDKEFSYVGFEKDEKYYEIANERIKNHIV